MVADANAGKVNAERELERDELMVFLRGYWARGRDRMTQRTVHVLHV